MNYRLYYICKKKRINAIMNLKIARETMNDVLVINDIIGYNHNPSDQFEQQLKHDADIKAQERKFSECLEYIVQLVNMSVIMSEP
jgi:hypothetical protein